MNRDKIEEVSYLILAIFLYLFITIGVVRAIKYRHFEYKKYEMDRSEYMESNIKIQE